MHFSNNPNENGLTIECQDKIKDTCTIINKKKFIIIHLCFSFLSNG